MVIVYLEFSVQLNFRYVGCSFLKSSGGNAFIDDVCFVSHLVELHSKCNNNN